MIFHKEIKVSSFPDESLNKLVDAYLKEDKDLYNQMLANYREFISRYRYNGQKSKMGEETER